MRFPWTLCPALLLTPDSPCWSLQQIQKAVWAGLGTLVTLSAPTELSVRWARELNLNLIHLPRHSDLRVFNPASAGMGAQP